MKVDDLFPSRYLHGSDLKGPVSVTIERLVQESMYKPGKGKTEGWVLYVKNGTRGVVLNKTIARQIAGALGTEETDEWIGKKIVLFPELVNVGNERVQAIRARAALENGS